MVWVDLEGGAGEKAERAKSRIRSQQRKRNDRLASGPRFESGH